MPEDIEHFAPYAPSSSVLLVIQRLRDRGLPDPLTTQELERVGVPASMTPRTHQALRFLGLLNESGGRTEAYERLRRAGSTEYPSELEQILRGAYKRVFEVIDPSQDDETALLDAFRDFEPAAQRIKMVRLFRGLLSEAGIQVAARLRGTSQQRGNARRAARPTRRSGTLQRPAKDAAIEVELTRESTPYRASFDVVQAIMAQLPGDGRWTRDRRDRWLQAVTAAVDLVVEVDESKEVKNLTRDTN